MKRSLDVREYSESEREEAADEVMKKIQSWRENPGCADERVAMLAAFYQTQCHLNDAMIALDAIARIRSSRSPQ